jgi:molecular chaperone DnaK
LLGRRARIKEEAEKAKKLLSSQQSVNINIPFIAMNNGVPVTINLELTRHEFEQMIKPLAQKTLAEVDRALNDINMSMSQIDEVLLVGGSTRIPYIQELVQKKFGKVPRKDINPDEAVAMGAAIQIGIKTGQISAEKSIVVTDIAPFSLGTDVVRMINNRLEPGHFDALIKRNSSIPAQKSETYSTVNDYQTSVRVGVYQGENQYCEQNDFLEEFTVEGIPSRRAGDESVEVTFKYDINGILDVDVRIVSTGKKVTRQILTKKGVMTDAEVRQAQQAVNSSWDQSELYKKVKPIIVRAEKEMDRASGADRQRLQDLLNKMKEALARQDEALVTRIGDEITDLLIELV